MFLVSSLRLTIIGLQNLTDRRYRLTVSQNKYITRNSMRQEIFKINLSVVCCYSAGTDHTRRIGKLLHFSVYYPLQGSLDQWALIFTWNTLNMTGRIRKLRYLIVLSYDLIRAPSSVYEDIKEDCGDEGEKGLSLGPGDLYHEIFQALNDNL